MLNTCLRRSGKVMFVRTVRRVSFDVVALLVAMVASAAPAFAQFALPTVVGDTYTTEARARLTVPFPGVLANDSSNGGGTMNAVLETGPPNGFVDLAENGAFVYTPSPGFSGTDAFTYRVRNSGGLSDMATVTITVTAIVRPPTGLHASAIVGNEVTLRFTPPATGLIPTGYVLKGGVTPGEVLATLPTGTTLPIFTFTAPSGAFFARMHTLVGTDESVASNEIQIFVNIAVPPSAPADLLGLVNGASLALAWRNTFAGGIPTSIVLDVTGAAITSLNLGLTDSFSFAAVPGGTYTFTVRATNATGSSGASNPVTLTFPGPCSGPPNTPSNFVAYKEGTTIFVVWHPATSGPAPTGFALNVAGSFVGSFPTTTRSMSGAPGAGSFDLSVVATNACGASPPTAVQTVIQ
jgi:hypothetical protein